MMEYYVFNDVDENYEFSYCIIIFFLFDLMITMNNNNNRNKNNNINYEKINNFKIQNIYTCINHFNHVEIEATILEN